MTRMKVREKRKAIFELRTTDQRYQIGWLLWLFCVGVALAEAKPDVIAIEHMMTELQVIHAEYEGVAEDHKVFIQKLDRSIGTWETVRHRAGYVWDLQQERWTLGVGPYNANQRTFTDSAVVAGTEYCYRFIVFVTNNEQWSGASACAVFDGGNADLRPPVVVENFQVVATNQFNHIIHFSDRGPHFLTHSMTGFWAEILRQKNLYFKSRVADSATLCFFTGGHGKNLCDSFFGTLKQSLRANLQNSVPTNTEELVQLMQQSCDQTREEQKVDEENTKRRARTIIGMVARSKTKFSSKDCRNELTNKNSAFNSN